jgi:hypothetical protein
MNLNKYLTLWGLFFVNVGVLYPASWFFIAPELDDHRGSWSLISYNQQDGGGWSNPLVQFPNAPTYGISANGDACFAWQIPYEYPDKPFWGAVVIQLLPEFEESTRTKSPGVLLRAMGRTNRGVMFSEAGNDIYIPSYVIEDDNHRFVINHYNRSSSKFSKIDFPDSLNLAPEYVQLFDGIGVFSSEGVYKLNREFGLKKFDLFNDIIDIGSERSWRYFSTQNGYLYRFSNLGELQHIFDQTLQLKARLSTTILMGRPIDYCLLSSSDKSYFAYISSGESGGKSLSIVDLSNQQSVLIEGDFSSVVSLSSAPGGNELMLVVEDGETSYIAKYRVGNGEVTWEEQIPLPAKYSALLGRLIVAE